MIYGVSQSASICAMHRSERINLVRRVQFQMDWPPPESGLPQVFLKKSSKAIADSFANRHVKLRIRNEVGIFPAIPFHPTKKIQMKIAPLAVALLSSVSFATEVSIPARQWATENGGSFTASVIDIKDGEVTFFASGKELIIPISEMSFSNRTDLRRAYGKALLKDDPFMADAIAEAREIREITIDRKARGSGYYKTPESEKTANIAREEKYRSAELARASVQQANAISRMNPVFYSDIYLGLLNGGPRTQYVNGYTRWNGTYVNPYNQCWSGRRW